MKTLQTVILALFTLISSQAFAIPEHYTIDPSHTYVLWHINHFKFSHPSGKWFAQGTLLIDQENPSNDKMDIVIDVANLSTGLPKLDEHLKSADFFDVVKYPQATYISTSVKLKNAKEATVVGNLTLHGVTKPVTLEVQLNNSGVSPMTNNFTVGFSAVAHIKRSDFGIVKYLPGLGDDVTLDIEAEAAKAK